MKNYRKLLLVVITTAAVFSFASCNDNYDKNKDEKVKAVDIERVLAGSVWGVTEYDDTFYTIAISPEKTTVGPEYPIAYENVYWGYCRQFPSQSQCATEINVSRLFCAVDNGEIVLIFIRQDNPVVVFKIINISADKIVVRGRLPFSRESRDNIYTMEKLSVYNN